MKATINGEVREVSAETLEELLRGLRVPASGTAVAINGRVVPKTQHATYRVGEGDRIEIIVAVAGG